MKLTFQRYRLTVQFDEGEFRGKTISFGGEQSENGPFLASSLFMRDDEELSAMKKEISEYCQKNKIDVVFEEIPPLPQTPCKIKGMFHTWFDLFILFEEGEEGGKLAGQAVRWVGELLANGFDTGPFRAEQITPEVYNQVHSGKIRAGYIKDLEIIGRLNRSKYPALIQAIQAYNETEEPFGKQFKIYI